MPRAMAVIGATGDVGSGIVGSAARRGWDVIAVGRSTARLDVLVRANERPVRAVVGDISSDTGGAELAAELGPVDAVVVSISPPFEPRPILDWSADELNAFVAGNVGAHLIALRHLLPLLGEGGHFLGIGGGMADLVIPRYVPMAVIQAAQRNLYRGVVREDRGRSGVQIRELLVASFVNGPHSRDRARPDWITDEEIGEHVLRLIEDPGTGRHESEVSVLRSPRELPR